MNRLRTISTVLKKEFIMIVRYPTWIIQLIICPLIFPIIYILSAIGFSGPDRSGLKAFSAVTGTSNYMGYIVIGTMLWMWVNTTMWGFGTFLREEQMRGTLESNWLCPINKFDFLLGNGLVSMLQALIINIISVLEYRFIYRIHFTGNISYWFLIFLIMIPGIYGLGALFASLVLWAKETNAAVQFVRGCIMILCGITFPISITPIWMQSISKCIPFTYGIMAARQLMVNGNTLKEASFNIKICLILGLTFFIAGRLAFLYTERRVKNQGTLGRF